MQLTGLERCVQTTSTHAQDKVNIQNAPCGTESDYNQGYVPKHKQYVVFGLKI